MLRELTLVRTIVRQEISTNDIRALDLDPRALLKKLSCLSGSSRRPLGKLVLKWRRFLQTVIESLLRQVWLEDLDGIVTNYEPCSGVWPNCETGVTLPVDFNLALNVDSRAEPLSIMAGLRFVLPLAVGREGQSTWLRIIEGRVKGLLTAWLAVQAPNGPLVIVVHLLHALRIHDQTIDDHIGRGRFGRLICWGELEKVFGVFEALLLKGPIRDGWRHAVLLEGQMLALELLLGGSGVDTRTTLSAHLCSSIESAQASSCLADVGLIYAHRIVRAVSANFGSPAWFTLAWVLADCSSWDNTHTAAQKIGVLMHSLTCEAWITHGAKRVASPVRLSLGGLVCSWVITLAPWRCDSLVWNSLLVGDVRRSQILVE